ncbi:hypothetical protein [Anabaena azotica]|uniref:Uncharacterized protein n=1 Tax=Anabaena azotica FACHB-119 TaxID=947527 RepID=A0ABR8DCL7_9NOST|nr:hypothetical protein [Anabaena azotica]MBD2503886.1 hypothetical protein [Anabaena azotica FACHB-119]
MDNQVETIIEKLRELKRERDRLLNSKLSPPGAWIHEYPVHRYYPGSGVVHTFIYAKWQAKDPIFERNPKKFGRRGKGKYTRHKHIGRVDSTTDLPIDERVDEAYEAWNNRKRLEEIENALREIEAILKKFTTN